MPFQTFILDDHDDSQKNSRAQEQAPYSIPSLNYNGAHASSQASPSKHIPFYKKLTECIHWYEPSVFATYYKVAAPVVENYTTMFLGLISYIFLTAAVVQDPSSYILAPDSRTIHPASIFKINGPITNAASLLGSANGNAQFSGSSSVTFDHGKNIAGVVSVTVGTYSSPGATISLTYTESSLYINNISCDMTAGPQFDEPISLPVGQGPGTYTVDRHHERGAFRYLTLTASNDASILVTSVSTQFTASPVAHDLRHYSGYFHANDEKLNRIWYAGGFFRRCPKIVGC